MKTQAKRAVERCHHTHQWDSLTTGRRLFPGPQHSPGACPPAFARRESEETAQPCSDVQEYDCKILGDHLSVSSLTCNRRDHFSASATHYNVRNSLDVPQSAPLLYCFGRDHHSVSVRLDPIRGSAAKSRLTAQHHSASGRSADNAPACPGRNPGRPTQKLFPQPWPKCSLA